MRSQRQNHESTLYLSRDGGTPSQEKIETAIREHKCPKKGTMGGRKEREKKTFELFEAAVEVLKPLKGSKESDNRK